MYIVWSSSILNLPSLSLLVFFYYAETTGFGWEATALQFPSYRGVLT